MRAMRIAALVVSVLILAAGTAAGEKEDQACLECHGQAGMKTEGGRNISVDPAKHRASMHGILACRDCHTTLREYPHPAKVPRVKCATCHAEESSDVPKSIHGLLGGQACRSCHGDVHELAAGAQVAPGKCAECHRQEVRELQESAHGRAAKSGDPDAPGCASCHGAVHRILAFSEAGAPVAKKNLPDTCAKCHSNKEFLSRHQIPLAHPVEAYRHSVHARAVQAGKNAASCSDCHGSHGIAAGREARAPINHWNVVATCGRCHSAIAKSYLASVHGQAMQAGVRDAPVCTDCHGEHNILSPLDAGSLVNAARVSMDTCARCHSDERLAERYNLARDRVPSYADSFHGLAMRQGSQTVANCSSCHGVHDIFRSSDPRSTVNPANLAKTCGHCHAGAGEKFAIGPVHVQTGSGPAHPVVQWIRWIYWVLIPLTLGFMVAHNGVDLLSKLVRRRPRHEGPQQALRMNFYFRVAHWGVMLSFPTLVLTGFALKYPGKWWAQPLLLWESHVAFRGTLHRLAAVVLVAATLYHCVHLAVNRRDRAFLKAMLPRFRDFTDLVDVFRYNRGLTTEEPKFTKFNYAEKMEYWAFLWGTAVMTFSGLVLWFNNFTLRYFPKWVLDAATAVHFYEALLATFSILLWHFYMVIFDPVVYPMDLAWLHGKVPAEHYRHTRPGYYRALMAAGLVRNPSGPAEPAAAAETEPEEVKNPPEQG
ncbi:MAG: cytochrome b/b6 domain-containing protein [Acidobacteriia bacterium]|nr:cytochrome b/b6 domain-containing protein [Terriglobia bacterium]